MSSKLPAKRCAKCGRRHEETLGHRVKIGTPGDRRWLCQECVGYICKRCGAPLDRVPGREVIHDDGTVGHHPILPAPLICTSPTCGAGQVTLGPSVHSTRPDHARRAVYGGVVFDELGRVYLREPTHDHDGYAWTFAMGWAEPGESAEDAARRQVLQGLGVEARIEAKIPGTLPGGTSNKVYFLMSLVRDTKEWELEESTEVRLVTPAEARALLAETTNDVGREQDLALLDAALELRRELVGEGKLTPVRASKSEESGE